MFWGGGNPLYLIYKNKKIWGEWRGGGGISAVLMFICCWCSKLAPPGTAVSACLVEVDTGEAGADSGGEEG